MDIEALSQMNSLLTNYLDTTKNNSTNLTTNTASTTQSSTGIVLAKKGESGYIEGMDSDNDGEITMEEFNEYCEANGVSGKDKVKLMTLMASAQTNTKLTEKASKSAQENIENATDSTEDTTSEDDSTDTQGAIYARKGDDNYNEAMDKNTNGVVTYQEYMEYCNEKAKNSNKNSSTESKETQTYAQNEHYDEEAEITVEAEV